MKRIAVGIVAILVAATWDLSMDVEAATAATTVAVNSTADQPDANLTDGVCATSARTCTLRAAVQQAAVRGGINTINLTAGATYPLTILGGADDSTDGAHGDLDVGGDLTIQAPGGSATIAGMVKFNDRILDVPRAASLHLIGIQVQGGHVLSDRPGGGISNDGDLRLTNSTVANNSTVRSGGGIYTAGHLIVENSTIADNAAGTSGGGIMSAGAGEQVINSTISGNSAALEGGGILNVTAGPDRAPNAILILGSTISDNSAISGGGLANCSVLNAWNSTISGNFASFGGGVDGSGCVGATTSLRNVTVADNLVDHEGGGVIASLGIYDQTFEIANSIIADNVALPVGNSDCADGTLTSAGYNLVEYPGRCLMAGNTTGNILFRDPRLGPLQNNAGPTFTQALLPGTTSSPPSPAIDAGAPAGAATPCFSTDQRGQSRPLDGNGDGVARCDIGAHELFATFVLGTFVLTPDEASVHAGDKIRYSLSWTVPGPGWRVLDTLQIRFRDDAGTAFWMRFHEVTGSPGTFAVVDPRTGRPGPSFAPRRPNRLESAGATAYLDDSSVDGPPGSTVTLNFDLAFKPAAAGRTYDVDVLASDDTGTVQGFSLGGTVTVLVDK
jgi:CSLREA domain-containing protein